MKTLVEMGIYTKYNNIFTNEKIKKGDCGLESKDSVEEEPSSATGDFL